MGPELAAAIFALAGSVAFVGLRFRNGNNGDLPPEVLRDLREIKGHLAAVQKDTNQTYMILKERLPRA